MTDKPTRAQAIVESRMAEAAAAITDFSHAMTDSVYASVVQEISDHHEGFFSADALRWAIFSGVARHLIDEAEKRLNPPEILSIPPDPNTWEKLAQAKRDHAAWMRRHRHRRRELIGNHR